MSKKKSRQWNEIREMIGDAEYLSLIENYAGTRRYIPKYSGDSTFQIEGLSREASQDICEQYGGCYLRVPLERCFRAKIYHGRGLSMPQIATKLGVTESAVEYMLRNMRRTGEIPPAKAPGQ